MQGFIEGSQKHDDHLDGSWDEEQNHSFRALKDSWKVAKSKRIRDEGAGPKSVLPLLGSYAEFKANIDTIKCRLTPTPEVLANHGAYDRSNGLFGSSIIIDPVPFCFDSTDTQQKESPQFKDLTPDLNKNTLACEPQDEPVPFSLDTIDTQLVNNLQLNATRSNITSTNRHGVKPVSSSPTKTPSGSFDILSQQVPTDSDPGEAHFITVEVFLVKYQNANLQSPNNVPNGQIEAGQAMPKVVSEAHGSNQASDFGPFQKLGGVAGQVGSHTEDHLPARVNAAECLSNVHAKWAIRVESLTS